MDAKENKLPINIEEEMRRSYLDYAMSVIIGRALPDVRDGLKPVHRRVLYAMYDTGNASDKPYRKSARVAVIVRDRASSSWWTMRPRITRSTGSPAGHPRSNKVSEHSSLRS